MNLDHLRYFLEAAKVEHFGKAAKTLGISPSAISHGISDLEEELGRELFLRQGKSVFVTPHGKAFAAKLTVALDHLSKVKEEALCETSEMDGHFRLGATHRLCAQYLTPAWAELQNEHSKLRAEIYTMRSAEVIARVAAGELDFGICVSPQAHPFLEVERVREGQLLIAVRKGHPILKFRGEKQLRALSDYTAVLPRASQGIEICGGMHHAMFDKFGIQSKYDCLVDSYDVAIAKITHSDSWGFLPDWLLKDKASPLVALKPPAEWDAPVWISAIWARSRPLARPLAQLLVELRAGSSAE